MFIRGRIPGLLFVLVCPCAHGQIAVALPPPSVSEKWNFFVSETAAPLTLAVAGTSASVSQWTRSFPQYGNHFWQDGAFPKRFGAIVGDDISQNFFADFMLASALREDTRYVRKGPAHKLWSRVGYAISRAVITRRDSGAGTFNWANVVGGAMSAGLSNAYYPPANRTAAVAVANWGINVGGAGLANLVPEFGSDAGHWMKRHLPFHH